MAKGDPVTLYRGVLTATAGTGQSSAPGNGATVTLWSSVTVNPISGVVLQPPFKVTRLVLSIVSSHDSAASGVIFEDSADASVWDNVQNFPQAYFSAAGESIYDVFVTKPYVRVRYINSANTLTKWQTALICSTGDRAALV
jgi:hypothetical protein